MTEIDDRPTAPDANGNGNIVPKAKPQAKNPLLRPKGPTSEAGKQKSRLNAITHGIFAVGIIPSRESKDEYLLLIKDLFESRQPEGKLEELLVEKLAMLVWRYRRLLQAEAADVSSQTNECVQKYSRDKEEAAQKATAAKGLIYCAITHKNDVALKMAIESLKRIRLEVTEKRLDWNRDEKALMQDYGTLAEVDGKISPAVVKSYAVMKAKGLDPCVPLTTRYREWVGAAENLQSGTDPLPDGAEFIVGMLTEDIEILEKALEEWGEQGDARIQMEVARMLVPSNEATDRFQRYEGNLDRSFDRTLSQLERLQRMRLGQPVLPAIKLDVTS